MFDDYYVFYFELSHFAQVALVFPNNDPVMFIVAFYGCLLAELVPVPIEVPLTRKVTAKTHTHTHLLREATWFCLWHIAALCR